MGWAADRGRLYGLVFRELGRSLVTGARRVARGPGWRVPRPQRLLFAPQDLRTSDPTMAQDIYAGVFVLAGRVVEVRGRSPFDVATSAPPDWAASFYGFDWLRHLRAADTPLARDHARILVSEALGARRADLRRGIARETGVVARRLISFLCQSPLVLNGADHGFYARFLQAVGVAVATLERDVIGSRRPADRLGAAVALSYAALCCSGFENRLKRATRLLSVELDRQILPDGGHVSRHPGLLVELLLDLLPLRLVYASRGLDTPDALRRAIDRMMPMLRYLRHPDGEIALFNGMNATAIDHVATLLSYDTVRGTPPSYAEQSGYARLSAGDTIVLADTGAVPPLAASGAAHAGCLSFEMSADGGRLVVNVGASPAATASGVACRDTAAHSVLGFGAISSAVPLERRGDPIARWLADRLGRVLLPGPRSVAVERGQDGDGWATLAARHDGYQPRLPVTHERRWALRPDGARLDGEDLVAVAGSAGTLPERTVRFHLHPSVSASLRPDGAIQLDRAGREPWIFAGAGGRLAIEDSLYLGGAAGWRPTKQIVLRPDGPADAPIRWHFERIEPDPVPTI